MADAYLRSNRRAGYPGCCPRIRDVAPRRSAFGSGPVPNWEETPYTPAVFARVANKGLRVYGTWKKIRKKGYSAELKEKDDAEVLRNAEVRRGRGGTHTPPPFCIVVKRKELLNLIVGSC